MTLSPILTTGIFAQENEFRDFGHVNRIPRQDSFMEFMETFTNEIIVRLSQAIDSMMSMVHSQPNREIRSAIAQRVIPEIQIL